jgi:hypothetical protein
VESHILCESAIGVIAEKQTSPFRAYRPGHRPTSTYWTCTSCRVLMQPLGDSTALSTSRYPSRVQPLTVEKNLSLQLARESVTAAEVRHSGDLASNATNM